MWPKIKILLVLGLELGFLKDVHVAYMDKERAFDR